mmetsp:Transcript_14394/g.36750  ORF Transcript_14394/g.36750 Transcript_14394/m.36750 type:complete len:365 (-) Transcript_14394:707-1801(-)
MRLQVRHRGLGGVDACLGNQLLLGQLGRGGLQVSASGHGSGDDGLLGADAVAKLVVAGLAKAALQRLAVNLQRVVRHGCVHALLTHHHQHARAGAQALAELIHAQHGEARLQLGLAGELGDGYRGLRVIAAHHRLQGVLAAQRVALVVKTVLEQHLAQLLLPQTVHIQAISRARVQGCLPVLGHLLRARQQALGARDLNHVLAAAQTEAGRRAHPSVLQRLRCSLVVQLLQLGHQLGLLRCSDHHNGRLGPCNVAVLVQVQLRNHPRLGLVLFLDFVSRCIVAKLLHAADRLLLGHASLQHRLPGFLADDGQQSIQRADLVAVLIISQLNQPGNDGVLSAHEVRVGLSHNGLNGLHFLQRRMHS